jgi:hypothetical protein
MPPGVRFKNWLRNARSNGLITAVAILVVAVLIAWGKVIER